MVKQKPKAANVLEMNESSKTAQDLEHAISELASKVDGAPAKPTNEIPKIDSQIPGELPYKDKTEPTVATPKQTAAKSKPKKKPATKKKPKSKKSSSRTVANKATVSSASSRPSIEVKKKTAIIESAPAEAVADPGPSRHGKEIKPLNQANEEIATDASEKLEDGAVRISVRKETKTESKSEASEPAKAIPEPEKVRAEKPQPKPKPYNVLHKAAQPETPIVATEQPKTHNTRKRVTPHVARLYDTRTYHIPLSVDYHHRKAMMPLWGQIVTVALALAAMAAVALISGAINL